MEIYYHPDVRLQLKVRMLKAEVIEALLHGCVTWSPNKSDYNRLLHGCVTWSPNKSDYNRLRPVHHSMLLRCLGWRKWKRNDHSLSYADALA